LTLHCRWLRTAIDFAHLCLRCTRRCRHSPMHFYASRSGLRLCRMGFATLSASSLIPACVHSTCPHAKQLDESGYHPGNFWAPAISITQLVGGPLLALDLLTRPVAAAVLVFLLVANIERWRVGRYFWNQLGLEYTLMSTCCTNLEALYIPGMPLRRGLQNAFACCATTSAAPVCRKKYGRNSPMMR